MNRALRAATIGALLLTPVTLSACSAGQLNQTSTQARDKTGPMAAVGNLALREVQLAYPDGGRYAAGDDAELTMAIANGGATPDQLVSVTGSGFTGFRVSGTGSAVTTGSPGATSAASTTTGSAPAGESSSTTSSTTSSASSSDTSSAATGTSAEGATTTAAGSTSATASGIAGATGSPTSSAASAPAGSQTVSVPAQSVVLLGQNAPHVFLEGLASALTPGQRIPVTFTFARAGSVTVQVVVATPTDAAPVTSSFNFTQPPDAATTSSAGQG